MRHQLPQKARVTAMSGARSLLSTAALVLQGCAGVQSPLNPDGDMAGRIAQLFWIFLAITAIVWLLVVATMLGGFHHKPSRPDPLALEPERERRMGFSVAAAAAVTTAILIALTLYSFFATRGLAFAPENALRISVTGDQWWWEVQYQDSDPSKQFVTANEIHLPVGRPVVLTLASRDVIHSFWVPNLAGKMDLIPGRTNAITFTPLKAGEFRGQCAEYCGLQHAHMALLVIAEPPEEFAAWAQTQMADAALVTDPNAVHGLDVFTSNGCAGCHTIRGAGASGMAGPDLTHLASRRFIAAGTLPNTRGNLQGWIADPQGIKPGAKMPRLGLSGPDLQAVTQFLSVLK